jgi:CRISPR/Cas system Type II protein with McrA/HNH and RuvC-like nuclease domain
MFLTINDTRKVVDNIVEKWGFSPTAWNISSCSNNRRFLRGNNSLQIKQEENVRHIAEIFEGLQYIDTNRQFTHS